MAVSKIAIVTGANTGMGFATTVALMKKGFFVIMACRSNERGLNALQKAKDESNSDQADYIQCDLGSLQSIHDFIREFRSRFDYLDVLINNAGVVNTKRIETMDGFEGMMGINHLGHFLLTNLLLEPLQNAKQGRIVVVSSGAYKAGKIHFDNPHLHNQFSVIKGYGQSKLANLLFTRELARRLQGTSITVNAIHPGAVSTSLGVSRETGFGSTIHKLLRPFFQTPAEGADTAIYLATDPNVTSSGSYYYKRKPTPLKKNAKDDEVAKRLWEWSEEEVHLK
ncbi:SDR family oxidoreductase [Pontibacillus sp. ALD_SL1]|uniref:SDR family oxidoreductase n=1 Tax=Pontibacillus sp. ALD_SL1 TaxID=2777185 RepID=UPI001A976764|nr:SDR family oxidoreductase [Pontibacillus sp. ALD_SL1]QSS98822.1 SDR family oxidoreductase [Pontibacillus sp. ALD_SL1]